MIRSVNLAKGYALFVTLTLAAGVAHAHTGHGTSGFVEGVVHPFGLDHLLAMVAVGVWSVTALPAGKIWHGPAAFMAALVVSAAVGAVGLAVPHIESLVSLSVVLFGAMLVFSKVRLPSSIGLAWVALAACLHGLAHGSETPASGFAAYALGFMVTTAGLHFGGVAAVVGLRRFFAAQVSAAVQLFGLLCGGAGVYLFSQI